MSSPARRKWQRNVIEAEEQRREAKSRTAARYRLPATSIDFHKVPVPPPEPLAPTFSECVVAYRIWRLGEHDGLLHPVSVDCRPWQPGVNVAHCDAGQQWMMALHTRDDDDKPTHSAPAHRCTCGFYAKFAPTEAPVPIEGERFISGAVAMWGNIEVHYDGIRAQKACVTALTTPNAAFLPLGFDPVVKRTAQRYGVPMVPHDVIAAEAQRHGASLPPGVRPPAPEFTTIMQQAAYTYTMNTWAAGSTTTAAAPAVWRSGTA
jgi:hypothetical protein